MTPDQCRMARAALKWSLDDLHERAGVGRATISRFEMGHPVGDKPVRAMRDAFEAARVRFIEKGPFKGGVTRIAAPG